MKKSLVFYLKTAIVLIGVILILIAGFSPMGSQRAYLYPGEFDETRVVFVYGTSNILWYIALFGSTLIFFIGYLFNGLVNKILVYVFVPIFTLVFLFFTVVEFMPTGATPFIPRMQYGYALMIYGSIFIITATIISMHRKTGEENIDSDKDILDN